jgi:ACS family hexuronate transporter-like MFS transporter
MDLKHIALFAWMPFLAADFGCVFGGLAAMRLQKQFGLSVINSRRSVFTLGHS